MEIVMLSLLMAWGVMRYAGTDAIAAARGTESPRVAERRQRAAQSHERAMARMGRRSGPTIGEAIGARIAARIANPRTTTTTTTKTPGPARTALAQWWADSWGYATERRVRRHERAERGELGRQRATRAARDWIRARRAQTPPTQATPGAPGTGRTGGTDDEIIDAELVDTEIIETETGPVPAGAGDGAVIGPDGGLWESCPVCRGSGPCEACGGDGQVPSWLFDPAVNSAADQWQTLRDQAAPADTDPQPDDASTHAAPATDAPAAVDLTKPATAAPDGPATVLDDDVVEQLNHDSAAAAATDPADLPPAEHDQHDPVNDAGAALASVHPIRGDIPTMTTTEHTMSSGETLDPQAGHDFVTGIKDLAEKIFTELELSVATLESRGVAGDPIDLLRQMQEAAQVLVANSETARGHFERHLATQDVVLSDDTLAGTVDGTYVGTRS